MDYLTPVLVLAVLALVAYALLFRKPAGGEGSSALLIEDLRRQLAQADESAGRERAEKTAALERAASAAASGQAAATQLDEANRRHEAELAQLRDDSRKALVDAEARYNKALTELRVTFEKTSADVLRGMAPDVTKEVANKVEPLITQVNAALENYRKAMQQEYGYFLKHLMAVGTHIKFQLKSLVVTTKMEFTILITF